MKFWASASLFSLMFFACGSSPADAKVKYESSGYVSNSGGGTEIYSPVVGTAEAGTNMIVAVWHSANYARFSTNTVTAADGALTMTYVSTTANSYGDWFSLWYATTSGATSGKVKWSGGTGGGGSQFGFAGVYSNVSPTTSLYAIRYNVCTPAATCQITSSTANIGDIFVGVVKGSEAIGNYDGTGQIRSYGNAYNGLADSSGSTTSTYAYLTASTTVAGSIRMFGALFRTENAGTVVTVNTTSTEPCTSTEAANDAAEIGNIGILTGNVALTLCFGLLGYLISRKTR